jgi:hypothetical protein
MHDSCGLQGVPYEPVHEMVEPDRNCTLNYTPRKKASLISVKPTNETTAEIDSEPILDDNLSIFEPEDNDGNTFDDAHDENKVCAMYS